MGQIFAIQRHITDKKTGKETKEIAYGLTSHSPASADAKRVLKFNREHWGVESHHYVIDWNWNEDRCSISKGYGPENITCLRRFATGLIKSISKDSVSSTIKKLARNVRRVNMQPAEQTANKNKFRWWSHVKRMAPTVPQSKAHVIQSEGRRPRGRTRNRWEDDVPRWYNEMEIPMTDGTTG